MKENWRRVVWLRGEQTQGKALVCRGTSFPNLSRAVFVNGASKCVSKKEDDPTFPIPIFIYLYLSSSLVHLSVRIHPPSLLFSCSSHYFSLSTNPQSSTPTWAHVLAHEDLPPPGPDHFAARRALWTTPTAASRLGQAPSTSCIRLENLLDEPGAIERPDVWDAGLDRVWKGLIGGGRLKNFLPLRAVV
jgi:hypothetical protein